MAFIRHVAIASKDPAATAEFDKQHFDLKELYPEAKGHRRRWRLAQRWLHLFRDPEAWRIRRARARARAVVGLLRHPPYRVRGRRSAGNRHRTGGSERAARERLSGRRAPCRSDRDGTK